MIYSLVQANQAYFPVSQLCRVLKVSKSGYYTWCDRPISHRARLNQTLLEKIKVIYTESDRTYGMLRVFKQLRHQGVVASRKRIARLMRLHQLRGVSRRRGWVKTTERDAKQGPAPDLVKRKFSAEGLNQLWVADMTYLPTWCGFLYLAVVIDVYSRKVVAWSFGEKMTADLVIDALNMAVQMRQPSSVIHHSDQGSQYTSLAFGKRCAEMNVKPSMGTVGDAYDNAMAESFFASLECELIDRRIWKTKTEARLAVFTWIEAWYNPKRLHSGLGYLSPNQFEKLLINQEEVKTTQNVCLI